MQQQQQQQQQQHFTSPHNIQEIGLTVAVTTMALWARFVERWLSLTQDKAKFLNSKNMQFELTKYCLAFTPSYSDGNTNCYSQQYKGR